MGDANAKRKGFRESKTVPKPKKRATKGDKRGTVIARKGSAKNMPKRDQSGKFIKK